jgi:hypothetical protein
MQARCELNCFLLVLLQMDNGFKIFRYHGEGPLVQQRVCCCYAELRTRDACS